jgi:bifunctional DNA-binding transcriptional regulator/antitoxin component of YhaV-PrlF toxin-antitoxin module
MLVKRSSKNQIAIPKAVLERAGLGPKDAYFDIDCSRGRIILTPMQLEEKVPQDALRRFEARVLKRERGDRGFNSVEGLIRHLHRKRRR